MVFLRQPQIQAVFRADPQGLVPGKEHTDHSPPEIFLPFHPFRLSVETIEAGIGSQEDLSSERTDRIDQDVTFLIGESAQVVSVETIQGAVGPEPDRPVVILTQAVDRQQGGNPAKAVPGLRSCRQEGK